MTLSAFYSTACIQKSRVAKSGEQEYLVRQPRQTLLDAATELAGKIDGTVVHVNPNFAAVVGTVAGKRTELYINMK